MQRVGKITSVNQILGLGEIIDGQDQEIFFELTDTIGKITPEEKVFFEIELKREGLRAVRVQTCTPGNG